MQQFLPRDIAGIATCTCLENTDEIYRQWKEKTLFLERAPDKSFSHLGFHMKRAGEDLALMIIKSGYKRPLFIGADEPLSIQDEIYDSPQKGLRAKDIRCQYVKTSLVTCYTDMFEWLSSDQLPDAIICSNYAFAQTLQNGLYAFDKGSRPQLYSVSALQTIPERSMIVRYELNYGLLGRKAAEMLINHIQKNVPMETTILENEGVRTWNTVCSSKPAKLNLLTMDSPTAHILKNITRLYRAETGIDVNIAIYSFEGYQEVLSDAKTASSFDIIRTDVNRLSWYANSVLFPLTDIDPSIANILDSFLPGLDPRFTRVNNVLYALPSTPSAELLFYRRNLFENSGLIRQYAEETGHQLRPPQTFDEYNHLARFFSRKFNHYSPVMYGTNMTLGSSSLAAKEYLTRFFSRTDSLFDKDGKIRLDQPLGIAAMQDMLAIKECVPQRFSSSRQKSAAMFAEGNIAMSILFSNYVGNALSPDSFISDDIGYVMVPGGNPLIGGGVIGICRYSQQKEAALALIRWLSNDIVSGAMTQLGSVSPCRKVYDYCSIIDHYPWLSLAKDCFPVSHTRQTPDNYLKPFNELKFLNLLGASVSMAYNNVLTPEEALHQASKSITQMLEEAIE